MWAGLTGRVTLEDVGSRRTSTAIPRTGVAPSPLGTFRTLCRTGRTPRSRWAFDAFPVWRRRKAAGWAKTTAASIRRTHLPQWASRARAGLGPALRSGRADAAERRFGGAEAARRARTTFSGARLAGEARGAQVASVRRTSAIPARSALLTHVSGRTTPRPRRTALAACAVATESTRKAVAAGHRGT